MLYFEYGYVFDTSDNTRQRVTEKYLINVLKLGIQIQGVSLGNNGELQFYNFRDVNLQRLAAFTDVKIRLDEGRLLFIAGCLPDNFELSLYCSGLSRYMTLKGNGTVILDMSLYIQPFYVTMIASNFAFDLRHLSDDSAFIVYSSLIERGINCYSLANHKSYYKPNVIIDETKHDLFLFATLLLRGDIADGNLNGVELCNEDEVVPLFKYWYAYYYSDIVGVDALAKYQKELSAYCQKYSIAFFNVLRGFFPESTVEYIFITLCKSYLSVYGKLPSRFKTGINHILKANKLN